MGIRFDRLRKCALRAIVSAQRHSSVHREATLTNQQLRTMPKRNKLSVRIPFLMDASAEGTLAIVLLFALVLVVVAVFGASVGN